jgi:uncharacterized OB-fold protein
VTEAQLPYPEPDGETQAFWDGIAEGRLRIQRCPDCREFVFYPRAVCPFCTVGTPRWVDASGRGTVHSFTVVHRAPPGFAAAAPYVVALVDLEEGPRLMTRLVDVAPAEARVGMAVEVAIQGEPRLPYFRPAKEI